jgi:hypothetical protein
VTRPANHYLIKPVNGRQKKLTYDRIVVRHGAVPPVARFIGEPGAKALFETQSWIGDFMEIPDRDPEFFDNSKLGLSSDPTSKAFAQRRSRMASEFILARHGLGCLTEINAVPPYLRLYLPPVQTDSVRLDGLPSELFGLRIDTEIGETGFTDPGTKPRS